jgi:predicted small lipoprotein YifL
MNLRTDFLRAGPLALAAALALGLAGCGVKGPLDPPPGLDLEPSAIAHQPPAQVPTTPGGTLTGPYNPAMIGGQPPSVTAVARGTTSTAVTAAPAARSRSALDWLVD